MAGLIAMRPGSRIRLCHRLRTHPRGQGKAPQYGERDFIALIDGIHQLVKAPIVLVWDRLNTHVSHRAGPDRRLPLGDRGVRFPRDAECGEGQMVLMSGRFVG